MMTKAMRMTTISQKLDNQCYLTIGMSQITVYMYSTIHYYCLLLLLFMYHLCIIFYLSLVYQFMVYNQSLKIYYN